MQSKSIRDVFLGANKRRYAKAKFAVDGKVHEIGLRSITEGERSEYEAMKAAAQDATDLKAAENSYRRRLLVIMCMEIGDDGNVTDTPVFKYDDLIAMEGIDYGVMGPVYNAAAELAFVSKADIEELAKNSVATAGGS
jgi:hypothetical protein